jgi:hypothetical protein
MQIIQNVDTSTFKFNGIKYPKNFMCIKQGADNISIHNAFDTRFQLLGSTPFNQVSVNGVIYTNQVNLISALATLIFSKQVIDSAGLNPSWALYGATDNLFNTNIGNVGIGTANPTQKLEVSGNTLINGGLTANTISATSITTNNLSANNIAGLQNYVSKFTNNGTFLGNSMIYDNGTNVGIGTGGSAAEKLQVSNGNILIDNTFGLSSFNSSYSSINKLLFSSNFLSGGAGNNVFLGNNLYNQSVSLFAGGNVSNVNERLSIQGNGYVGIGTNSPSKELSMVRKSGTFTAELNSYGSRSDFWLNRASGTYSAPTTPSINAILGKMIFGAYDSNTNGFIEAAKIEATIDSNTGAGDLPTRLAFYTTPDGSNIAQERLRIDNKGNLGIGTISPSARLMVKGESNTSSTNSFKVQNSDGYEALRINDDGEIFLSPLDTDDSQIALLARKSDGKLCRVNSTSLIPNLNLQDITNNGNTSSNSINTYEGGNFNNFSELKYNQLILAHTDAGGGVGLNADYTTEYYRLQAPNKIGGSDRTIATTEDIPNVSGFEVLTNKQNSLVVDGTGQKYSTVDAVNSGLNTKLNLTGGVVSGSLTASTVSATTLNSPTLDNLIYDKVMTNQLMYFLPMDGSTVYDTLRTGGSLLGGSVGGSIQSLNENPMGILYTTSTAVGSAAGQYGNPFGGSILSLNFQFELIRKFRINTTNGNQRFFTGISSLYGSSIPTNIEPIVQINSIGVAKLQTGSTLCFVWNDNAGTASYLDLGSNFPATSTAYTYKLKISKTYGVAAINLELTRITNSDGSLLVTSTIITTDYNTGASYYPVMWMGNNTAVSGAVSFKDYGCIMTKSNKI